MSRKYDYIVYIGRFQPFHVGHLETLHAALDAGKEVIIVIGSANSAPTPINPFSAETRKRFITNVIALIGKDFSALHRIHFVMAEDRLYNMNKWVGYVQSSVDKIAKSDSIALIGHDKGDNPYTLKNLFPTWDFVDTGAFIKHGGKVVSSTKIRELLFEGHLDYTESNLPTAVFDFLKEYVDTSEFTRMQAEYINYINEEKEVALTTHGMNFITADSVVVQSGHILLVQRDDFPGKGLWALPGVHVDQNESFQEASIRALVKETHLKVPVKVLKGSLVDQKMFDHPDRSLRGRLTQKRARTVSMAYYYELDSSQPLPKNVRGGEGIAKAWWFPFSKVRGMRNELFEDHPDIIDYFIG